VSDRRPAIVYAGRISREKGLALLPGIRSALYRRGIDHRFVLVGDGPMRAELQARLPDAVFTGTLSSQDVAIALASSDLFLFPSETDSAGNVVLEAQACGVPALVTDRGGPKEYIKPNQTGYVCFAGDAEGFACHGASLLHEVRRRRQMGNAARAHALTLRWDAALQPLYQVYTEVAARGRAAGAGSTATTVSDGAVA
jgi:glycosyltransferase involved in cell wall biosynthesis